MNENNPGSNKISQIDSSYLKDVEYKEGKIETKWSYFNQVDIEKNEEFIVNNQDEVFKVRSNIYKFMKKQLFLEEEDEKVENSRLELTTEKIQDEQENNSPEISPGKDIQEVERLENIDMQFNEEGLTTGKEEIKAGNKEIKEQGDAVATQKEEGSFDSYRVQIKIKEDLEEYEKIDITYPTGTSPGWHFSLPSSHSYQVKIKTN